ncbi:hypothetical protein Bbelb_375690 [Branchiostoma belcheri]|nr:hypothetical protein Bbelb_375690 [Branchiostoma belcheri]
MGKKGKNKRSKRGHGVGKNAKHLPRRGEKRRKTETEDATEEEPAKKLRRLEEEERVQDGACTPEGHAFNVAGEEQRLKKLCVDDETPVSPEVGGSAGQGHLGNNLPSDDVMTPQGPENLDAKHQKNKNKTKKETSSQETQAVLHLTLNNLEAAPCSLLRRHGHLVGVVQCPGVVHYWVASHVFVQSVFGDASGAEAFV